MNLLYCNADGVVVAMHSDEQPFVPLEVYPTVVRVIPHDGSVPLARIGEPPTQPGRQPGPDTRPYRQPEPTPDVLKLYAAQCRFVKECSGFEFTAASGKVPVWTDRASYNYICGLATYATNVPNNTAIKFTQGQISYQLTVLECKNMFVAYTELMQRARTAEAQCLADLNAATPSLTTYEDVDEAFVGVVHGATAKRPLMSFPK